MNFTQRCTDKEMMDDQNLDADSLKNVLQDINKVNKILNGYSITLNAIGKLIKQTPKKSYTILDVGCGDGYMLRKVAHYFKSIGIAVNLVGIDLNEKTLKIARANSVNYPNISYLHRDVLLMDLKEIQCDIMLCTLTMHHFKNDDIPEFLRKSTSFAQLGVIINDLQRSKSAYYLFKIYSAIFMKTRIAKHDGLLSIKSAFTKSELQEFSKLFPEAQHELSWKWAFRYLWIIELKQEQPIYD
ncbi:MAG: methyltransferase domain-containing protein [Arenibacter latericius]|nr:methyltransferase domain-containing protein [Arenibacter latericius]